MKKRQTVISLAIIFCSLCAGTLSFLYLQAETSTVKKSEIIPIEDLEAPVKEVVEVVSQGLALEEGFDIAIYRDCGLAIKFPSALDEGYKGNLRGFFYDERNKSAFLDIIIGIPGKKSKNSSVLCYDNSVSYKEAVLQKKQELEATSEAASLRTVSPSDACKDMGLAMESCKAITSSITRYSAQSIFGGAEEGYILSANDRTYVFHNNVLSLEYQFDVGDDIDASVSLRSTPDQDFAGTTLLHAF